jgi:hypothetical protein
MSDQQPPFQTTIRCSAQERGCEGEKPVEYVVKRWWYRIEGWTKQREAGGTNAVRLMAAKGEYMCDSCMYTRNSGRGGQEGLF